MAHKRLTTQRKRSACGQLRLWPWSWALKKAMLVLTWQFSSLISWQMIWKCAAPHHSSVGSCCKLWFTFTIALKWPLYLAQHRRLIPFFQRQLASGGCSHANQKKRSGSGWTAVPAAKRLWGADVGRLPSLDWNIGVSEALECDNGALSQSEEPGRVHLHVFMEFGQAVDWTSLRCRLYGCEAGRGEMPSRLPWSVEIMLCPCEQGCFCLRNPEETYVKTTNMNIFWCPKMRTPPSHPSH